MFIYSKKDPLDVIHRFACISNFFMVLEKSSEEIFLVGRSRLSESLQLYQILHPSAAT